MQSSNHQKARFALLMFLSGSAGLIYQVVWVRELGLIFGNTIWAVSTVVAGFLAGLALGSGYIGRKADKKTKPLRLYRNIEFGIAVSAVAVTLLMRLFDSSLTGMIDVESLTSTRFVFIRFFVLLILLVAPTFLMGGTLPTLARALVPDHPQMGATVGKLYSANTYGGLFGAFLTGFLLIPFFGVTATLGVAVGLNIMCGLIAHYSELPAGVLKKEDKRKELKKKKKKKKELKEQTRYTFDKIDVSQALFFFFVAGFCTLAYEVLWTRAFVVSFKSTVYLFSNLLAVFLFGMALGSHLISRIIDKLKSPLAIFGLTQLGIGILGIASVLAMMLTPDLSLRIAKAIGGMSFGRDMAVSLLLMSFVFFLPALLMGFGYPLVCKIVTRSLDKVGTQFGFAYSAGTFGSIAGSLVAGFMILPSVGLQTGLFIVSGISLTLGYVALFKSGNVGRFFWTIPVSGFIAIALVVAVVVSGADIGLGAKISGDILYANEGVMGSVRVVRRGKSGPATLLVNNYQLATSGDVAVRFGHLPLLLMPEAKDVLVVSLGSGITSGAVSRYDLDRIDAVEIVPALKNVQPFFEQFNHNVIKDPRFHLTLWDGRHYISASKRKWDLVIADLFQPDSAGVGSLYSVEHFTNVRRHLKAGGAMAQWLPLYQLSPESLRIIIKTFSSVFPHIQLWFGDINSHTPTLMMIGTEEKLRINPAKLFKRLANPKSEADMIERDDPLSFLSFYITDETGIASFVGSAPINSDDRPRIEYMAPRRLWSRSENALLNFNDLSALRRLVTPVVMGAAQDKKLSTALERYYKGRTDLMRGKVMHASRNYSKALKAYKDAARLIPHDPFLALALFDVGYLYYDRRDYVSAGKILAWSASVNPDLIEARFYLAKAYKLSGDQERAGEVIRALVRSHPDIARSLFKGN